MRYSQLGRTDIQVSRAGLGTMIFGEQVKETEAFTLMDYALDQGVNLFDTAELYAIPTKPETAGATETIIGNWFKQTGKRDQVVLASKVMGRDDQRTWLRTPPQTLRLTREQIDFAVEGSLRRLQTDRIDLYQLHFPDRKVKALNFNVHPDLDDDYVPFEDIVESLERHIEKGNIRHWGVSNETSWGLMRYVAEADKAGRPRPVSIQNNYSLLDRDFEYGLVEDALRENIGLLAFSPLATGVLTGKYLNGVKPAGARQTLFGNDNSLHRPGQEEAVKAYRDLALSRGIRPETLALKFVDMRPFVTSVLVGARTLDQLKINLAAFDIDWPEELEKAVHEVYRHHRMVTARELEKAE